VLLANSPAKLRRLTSTTSDLTPLLIRRKRAMDTRCRAVACHCHSRSLAICAVSNPPSDSSSAQACRGRKHKLTGRRNVWAAHHACGKPYITRAITSEPSRDMVALDAASGAGCRVCIIVRCGRHVLIYLQGSMEVPRISPARPPHSAFGPLGLDNTGYVVLNLRTRPCFHLQEDFAMRRGCANVHYPG
jgi:hypothetical protein